MPFNETGLLMKLAFSDKGRVPHESQNKLQEMEE